ncbi:putative PcfJ protein [Salmonella phage 18-India]|nr:putative PcfJ protein [Salmonella phage 18-India]
MWLTSELKLVPIYRRGYTNYESYLSNVTLVMIGKKKCVCKILQMGVIWGVEYDLRPFIHPYKVCIVTMDS